MKALSNILLILLLFPLQLLGQAVQTIKGTVTDEASKAPLIGVTIVVVDQPSLGAVTDVEGRFRLPNVPIGRHTLRISYLGYEERMVHDLVVTAGKEVDLGIMLRESVQTLDEVKVSYNRELDKTRTVNEMAQVSARSFNVDETRRYAGSLGDPSRMAANFAGVVSGNASRNDIVVRGNAPPGMLWQMEGLNIPNPNHFGALNSTGGPVSMLNNNNIAKSDFFTSAFPAQYGNALAGVFDLRLREGNREKNEFVGQVGFNGFEAGAEGPVGRKKQTSYLVNYRYSTLGVFKSLGLDLGTGSATPIYQDVNYKITSRLNNKIKLTVFGIAGNSKAYFMGKDTDTTQPDMYGGDAYKNIKARYASTITGASVDYQFNARTSARLALGYSTTFEHFEQDTINYEDGSETKTFEGNFQTGKASAVFTLHHKLNARNNLQAGLIYDHTSFVLRNKRIWSGGLERIYADETGDLGLAQGYLQWRHRFNNQLSAVAGLHSQLLTLNNSFALEPRASIQYAFARHHSLSAGYGLHHQMQSIYSYFVQTPTPGGILYTNKELDFTRSHHMVLTYDWNITNNMRLKVEGYYQQLQQVPVEQRLSSYSALNYGSDFSPPNTDSLMNGGTGQNFGTEITLEHFFTKGYYFLVTTSLFDSRYKGSDGVERNSAFNTGYVLNVLGGKEFKIGKKGSVLALNIRTSWVGGRYLTPIDLAASAAEKSAVYLEDMAYSEKQPDYFRLDFRIAYRKELRKSTMEFSLDLQNLTNHKNIFSQTYDERNNRLVNNYQQGFFPVPFFRYTF